MALVSLENLRTYLCQLIFKANKLSLQGISNAIFDGIYSNKDKKTSIACFFCFGTKKHWFYLIFSLIVTKFSKRRF